MAKQSATVSDFMRRVFLVPTKVLRPVGKDERIYVKKEHSCPSCGARLDDETFLENQYVCDSCNHHFRLTSQERMQFLADNGEYHEFDMGITSKNPLDFPDYNEKYAQARQKTGHEDALKSYLCSVMGRDCVVAVMNFAFMGASMGSVVGEKFARAVLEAAERRLPFIIFTCSGGARMQEGILSLMQMAKTSHATALLEAEGLPYFVVLTDPTTGGVTASFAMLGDVCLAEPGALIGFAGARVIEGTLRAKLPEGFQRSEFQLEHGYVDLVVDRKDLRKQLAFLIDAHMNVTGVRK
jgi:acetyl-CoA carboxylase carboxyl transferase subunit beta